MQRRLNLLAILVLGAFLFGCGQVPKEAVEELGKNIDDLETKLTEAEPVLVQVADLEEEAAGKLSKKGISELLDKIDNTKGAIAQIVALDDKVDGIEDSLDVLSKKAAGKIKEDIAALIGKVETLDSKLDEFEAAEAKLDDIKAGLEEKKAAKPAPKPKPKPKPQKKKIK